MFDIFLDIPAQKFLKKLEITSSQRIIEAIRKLTEDPIPHDSKRIIGEKEKVFRIRVGKFRVLYRVDYENYRVVVINIDYRDRVYK
ncbi:MAG TPA: type II toxin-antitoxin system RelE/ParE family toxin [Candidatus Nanoarchaeia archaeon]|jgi:mRNA interferase RelE/StbE|nr:type II toxin-antitoxin system RelE/ParE family toxin [Candidatus Nanoarchaeia archaeon]